MVLVGNKPQKRTAAPTELGVAEIEVEMEALMTAISSMDLTDLLLDMKKEITWKNEAKPSVMAKYAVLYFGLKTISPQAVLPPKKTALALLAAHRNNNVQLFGPMRPGLDGRVFVFDQCRSVEVQGAGGGPGCSQEMFHQSF